MLKIRQTTKNPTLIAELMDLLLVTLKTTLTLANLVGSNS